MTPFEFTCTHSRIAGWIPSHFEARHSEIDVVRFIEDCDAGVNGKTREMRSTPLWSSRYEQPLSFVGLTMSGHRLPPHTDLPNGSLGRASSTNP